MTTRTAGTRGLAVGVPLLLAAIVTAGTPGWTGYVVKRGDTLSAIADRYGTTVATLTKVNDLPGHGNLVYAGSTIQVPGPAPAPAAARAAKPGATTAAASTTAVKHRVRSGEYLGAIADKYGVSVASIVAANDLASAHRIRIGQTLTVRVPSKPATPAAPAKTAANTFAGRTYSNAVVSAAARNRAALAARTVPSREAAQALIVSTAKAHGVDPALALGLAYQESGFDQRKVSVANAVGIMQVIPATGDWMSQVVGRKLDLLDAEDNVLAGVVLLRVLGRAIGGDEAVAAYYQGLSSVRKNGMFTDTKRYVANVRALQKRFATGWRP